MSKVVLTFALLVSISVLVAAFVDEIGDIVTPIGVMVLVVITPLIAVLVPSFMKANVIIAGLIGGVLVILIGGIGLEGMNKQVLEAILIMLGTTVPIINSAVAMTVFKAGNYSATSTLAEQGTKGKIEYVSTSTVISLATAIYMSGIGGESVMVIALLALAVIDVIPELTVAMSLAAVVSLITSPASLESSIVSKSGDVSVGLYVPTMRPCWLFFVALAIVLAFWGTRHRSADLKEPIDDEFDKESNGRLFRTTLSAIFLLFAVVPGPIVNDLIDLAFFTPLVYVILTLVLIFLYTDFSMNKSAEAMVGGSIYILTRLFQVGIFLTFTNVITQTGTFAVITGVAENASAFIVVPVAILTGILTGVPAGAYAGSVLTLVLLVAVSLNFPPLALGFVAVGVGLGSQMSFVNITI